MVARKEIRRALRGFQHHDSYIGFRASHIEKKQMQSVAKSLGLNLTNYLIGLHRHAQVGANDAD